MSNVQGKVYDGVTPIGVYLIRSGVLGNPL